MTSLLPSNDLAEGFAAHLLRWAKVVGEPAENWPLVAVAGYATSLANQEGHVCIEAETLTRFLPGQSGSEVIERLQASRVVADARNRDFAPRPLVLDGAGRLYLHRYFSYERRLARCLTMRHAPFSLVGDEPRALPPEAAPHPVDWQRIATALAWQRRLTIISGGPGTGKTTTVVRLLARLLEQNPNLKIALAAPTGKAAARMLEALRAYHGSHAPALYQRLPRESFTLHRLLGVTKDPGRFRHHADNPLPFDVVIVDEASMLDLALATRLFEAVPLTARLILLGDKDQLAAVEAGAVFAELSADPSLSTACIERLAAETGTLPTAICPPPPIHPTPLCDSVIWFCESHRFSRDSGIGRLAADINAGAGEAACAWMAAQTGDGATDAAAVTWLEESPLDAGELPASVRRAILSGYQGYLQALRTPEINLRAIFQAFNRFRVLCAVRESSRGVRAINRLVEQYLRHEQGSDADANPWYRGRPIMVQQNDYALSIFNGEVGICLPDESGQLMVYFPEQATRLAEEGGGEDTFRAIAPLRLPEHDSAFASTVHKSQGSEFAVVLLLLPAEPSRVLSRELLYTGTTRAAQRVILAGSREVFLAAVNNPTKRHSGLIARLQEQVLNRSNREDVLPEQPGRDERYGPVCYFLPEL